MVTERVVIEQDDDEDEEEEDWVMERKRDERESRFISVWG